MAVLNKIRQRSLFLILIIALALFAFVLSDLFRNSSALSGASQDVVASVDGTDINRQDFMVKVDNAQRQAQGQSTTQVMNRVYDQEVRNTILKAQLENLGLSVEQDQMRALLKTNFSAYAEFNNEAGTFDENKLNEFIANLKAIQNTAQNRAVLGSFQISYAEWVNNEEAIALRANEQSYFTMISAGVNSTLNEAETDYLLQGNTRDLKYVNIPFTSIPDSEVEVSKSDISKFINDNKSKYEVEATRDIAFVEFKEVATVEDETEIKNSVAKLLEDRVEFNNTTKANETILGFKNTKDIEGFVNSNSDLKYNDAFVAKSALPTVAADEIYNLNAGEFYGPYKDNGYYKLSKVVAVKQIPDSVKVRHILVTYAGARNAQPDEVKTIEVAKKLADSIASVVKNNNSKFAELVTEYSADPGSVDNGGEYDFHPYNTMVKAFNDFEFENNVGDVDVIETIFGYHVIEILDQKNKSKAIKVATVAQVIEPSERTIDNVFNTTSKFEVAIQDAAFQDVAKENNYVVKPVSLKVLDENIPGLGSQRTIVRWAFEAGTNVGDSKRFPMPGGGYAVIQLVKANKAGLMSAENASASAIAEIRNEKKAKLILDKISGTTLEEVATNNGVSVSSAAAVNMQNPTLSGAGVEPKVVGTAFGLEEGIVSKPVVGTKGVYLVQVSKITPAAKLDNYQPMANRLSLTRASGVQTKAYNALKEAAEIEDNRPAFY